MWTCSLCCEHVLCIYCSSILATLIVYQSIYVNDTWYIHLYVWYTCHLYESHYTFQTLKCIQFLLFFYTYHCSEHVLLHILIVLLYTILIVVKLYKWYAVLYMHLYVVWYTCCVLRVHVLLPMKLCLSFRLLNFYYELSHIFIILFDIYEELVNLSVVKSRLFV